MENKNLYVPMNRLIETKDNTWTFTSINLSYPEIAKQGIILWCIENMQGRWTMAGGNKFGFEEGMDATAFTFKFGK
jgi:hypothetical protein